MVRIKPECVELVMEKTAVGDWFLLYLLGQNIDHIVFKVFLLQPIHCNNIDDHTVDSKSREIIWSDFFQDVFHELAKKLGYRSKGMTDP